MYRHCHVFVEGKRITGFLESSGVFCGVGLRCTGGDDGGGGGGGSGGGRGGGGIISRCSLVGWSRCELYSLQWCSLGASFHAVVKAGEIMSTGCRQEEGRLL